MSNLIALGALFVSLLSAIYARRSYLASKRANEIAVHQQLRPLRLQVYRSMKEFADFCSTYHTKQCIGAVTGTRDLVAQIGSFKSEIEQHGPLAMPLVEAKASEFEKKAWQLQRVLDKIAGGQNNPHNPAYGTAMENADGLIDWFGTESREIKKLFKPYLDRA